MSLQQRLDALKSELRAKAAPEAQATMRRATSELKASGLAERAAKVGANAPTFARAFGCEFFSWGLVPLLQSGAAGVAGSPAGDSLARCGPCCDLAADSSQQPEFYAHDSPRTRDAGRQRQCGRFRVWAAV